MHTALRHCVDLAPRCLPGVDALDITSERRFPRHAHDQFGIGVIRSGGHASWSGVGPVGAGPGDVIAVNPEEMHDGAPIRRVRAWRMIYVDPATVARLVGTGAAACEIPFAASTAPALARSVLDATNALREGDAAAAEEALTGLLGDLMRPSRTAGDRVISAGTIRALERIHDCPDAPPNLDEVAAIMGMERTGALRRFRREVGATPHDYAMQLRLRLARRALSQGEVPAAVAAGLGVADQSHLTRAFARQFAMTPGLYRTKTANIVQDRVGGPAGITRAEETLMPFAYAPPSCGPSCIL